MATTKVHPSQLTGIPVLHAPKLNLVVPDSYAPNNTGNFELNGAFFTPDMTVSITGNNVINKVTFESDNKVIVNITTSSVEGSYDITLNNGTSVTFTGALLVVLGEVYTPTIDEFQVITAPVDLTERGAVKIATASTLGKVKVDPLFYKIEPDKNFEIRFSFKESPLMPSFPITSDGLTKVNLVRTSDNVVAYDMQLKCFSNGSAAGRNYTPGADLLFDIIPGDWRGITFKFRRIDGVYQMFTNDSLRGTMSYNETAEMYITIQTQHLDIFNIKLIDLA